MTVLLPVPMPSLARSRGSRAVDLHLIATASDASPTVGDVDEVSTDGAITIATATATSTSVATITDIERAATTGEEESEEDERKEANWLDGDASGSLPETTPGERAAKASTGGVVFNGRLARNSYP